MNTAIKALEESPVRRHQNGAASETPAPSAASEHDGVTYGPEVYKSLEDLVKAEPVGEKGKRPYCVISGEQESYVFANSAGNAALATCCVSAVTQKELLTALANAVKQTK